MAGAYEVADPSAVGVVAVAPASRDPKPRVCCGARCIICLVVGWRCMMLYMNGRISSAPDGGTTSAILAILLRNEATI